jgi:GNAT superfamily N-acetyltransferase
MVAAPPSQARLFEALDATWPPKSAKRDGDWLIRDGDDGGKRVSAASWLGADLPSQIPANLVVVREPNSALDRHLDASGYGIIDPVHIYIAPAYDLASKAEPGLSAIPSPVPLARMEEIWANGGIDTARLRVMERGSSPKCYVLGRQNDKPAGAAFVAIDRDVAMLHALEVPAELRGKGIGRAVSLGAAKWAASNGASWFALMTTTENTPANRLYQSLGMQIVAGYHYRIR